MPIKHPKGKRMNAFDRFIGSGLILARCRFPASLIRRVQWRDKKGFMEDTGKEFRILSFDFSFRISFFACNAPVICIGHN